MIVDWNMMMEVSGAFGFGPVVCHWIYKFYNKVKSPMIVICHFVAADLFVRFVLFLFCCLFRKEMSSRRSSFTPFVFVIFNKILSILIMKELD